MTTTMKELFCNLLEELIGNLFEAVETRDKELRTELEETKRALKALEQKYKNIKSINKILHASLKTASELNEKIFNAMEDGAKQQFSKRKTFPPKLIRQTNDALAFENDLVQWPIDDDMPFDSPPKRQTAINIKIPTHYEYQDQDQDQDQENDFDRFE
jgi:hypothetical protein